MKKLAAAAAYMWGQLATNGALISIGQHRELSPDEKKPRVLRTAKSDGDFDLKTRHMKRFSLLHQTFKNVEYSTIVKTL
jgi:hypothetical protein